MVAFKGLSRFYSRNSASKYQLDVGEIRAAPTMTRKGAGTRLGGKRPNASRGRPVSRGLRTVLAKPRNTCQPGRTVTDASDPERLQERRGVRVWRDDDPARRRARDRDVEQLPAFLGVWVVPLERVREDHCVELLALRLVCRHHEDAVPKPWRCDVRRR